METTDTTLGASGFAPMPDQTQINLSLEAQSYLREAGKWATFLGIMGFILSGFILLGALFISAIMAMVARMMTSSPLTSDYPGTAASGILAGVGGVIITVVYLVVALIYFFFSLYLYQFGSRIKKGILFADGLHITSALSKLKSFFKLWGIITIIVMIIYALIIVVAIIAGIGAASMSR